MKKLSFFLMVALTGLSAIAAPAKPLIVKSSGGGFVIPEFAGFEKCEIYQNRVVITHVFGTGGPTAAKLVEERKITLTGDFAKIIEVAKSEKVETKPNSLCDGPSTGISANPALGESILLYSTGGCGSPRKSREGLASNKLRAIADLYCEKTYDFSQEN